MSKPESCSVVANQQRGGRGFAGEALEGGGVLQVCVCGGMG